MVRQGFIRIAVLASTTIHGLTFLGSILIWIVIYLLTSQVEYDRFNNSTGKYEVVLTYPKLYHFMPAMPGQGSDISGSIAIYDRDGNFYGAIPWISYGMAITLNGLTMAHL